jgi:hypothetical protein
LRPFERRDELDRSSFARAAHELQERYQASFEARGGRLSVDALTASNIPTRTKHLELQAGVEWEASRIYEHSHAEIARRPWFSRRWQRVRSLEEAVDQINTKLAEWLRQA